MLLQEKVLPAAKVRHKKQRQNVERDPAMAMLDRRALCDDLGGVKRTFRGQGTCKRQPVRQALAMRIKTVAYAVPG